MGDWNLSFFIGARPMAKVKRPRIFVDADNTLLKTFVCAPDWLADKFRPSPPCHRHSAARTQFPLRKERRYSSISRPSLCPFISAGTVPARKGGDPYLFIDQAPSPSARNTGTTKIGPGGLGKGQYPPNATDATHPLGVGRRRMAR